MITAIAATWRLFVIRLVRPARLAVPLAGASVVIALGAAAGASGRSAVPLAARLVDEIALVLAAPLGSLVIGAAVLGAWVDDDTITYLRVQPLSRWGIASSAWLAALSVALPVAVASVAIGVVASTAGPEMLLAASVAAAIGALAYTSAFVALGLRSRSAVAWGLAYVLLWEAFVSEGSRAAAALSVRQAALSIGSRAGGVELAPTLVSPSAAAALLSAVVLLSLWATKRGLDRG